MPFPDIDPVLVQLGPFAVRWYALGYVVGILLAWRYSVGLTRTPRLWGGGASPVKASHIDDLVLWVTLGVIVGGRVGYVLVYDQSILREPLGIFAVWQGGMSFHGGLVGVILAIVGFALANRLPMLRVGDVVAPGVPFAIFLVRCANFINGELWGRPTDAPWGVVFCNERLGAGTLQGCAAGWAPRHPSQLYEAALEGVALWLLLRWATHQRLWLQRPGVVTGLFLTGYALSRMLVETVRNPDAQLPDYPLGLTMGMMLSLPMLLAGLGLVAWGLRRPPAAPLPAPASAPTATVA